MFTVSPFLSDRFSSFLPTPAFPIFCFHRNNFSSAAFAFSLTHELCFLVFQFFSSFRSERVSVSEPFSFFTTVSTSFYSFLPHQPFSTSFSFLTTCAKKPFDNSIIDSLSLLSSVFERIFEKSFLKVQKSHFGSAFWWFKGFLYAEFPLREMRP